MTDPNVDLVGLLAGACQRLLADVFSALDRLGYGDLTSTQAMIVRGLTHGDGTVSALAAAAGTTGPAMSKATAGLVQRGLLSRRSNPNDARSRYLRLTAEGQRVAAAMAEAEADALVRWEGRVGVRDLQAVRRALAAFMVDDTPVTTAAAPRRIRFE